MESYDRLGELRKKRDLAAEQKQFRELRARYGPELASIVSEAISIPLSLECFVVGSVPAHAFDWPKKIENAPGLALAYVRREIVESSLFCIEKTLGKLSGSIGFHGKNYFGLAEIDFVEVSSLLKMAEKSADSAIFFVRAPVGAILVDYYRSSPSQPYSIVVQGPELVKATQGCFDAL